MRSSSQPLADLLRPATFDSFIGQSHLLGDGQPIRVALALQSIFSMVFWGPPGVGKTTLARIIATETDRKFVEISAVSAGKADVKQVIEDSRQQQSLIDGDYRAPVLFIDEIHRFNKIQQDFLLPYVENGSIILIGATTENPSFNIISPLLSRMRVFVFRILDASEMSKVLEMTIKQIIAIENQNDKKLNKIDLSDESREFLLNYSNGDARKLITTIDNTWTLYGDLSLTFLHKALQNNHLNYDKKGEMHYDTISAFIKSMRASNVDASLYYLARMVEAGEDPLFIARRMVIFASEDIGLAVPTALVVANAVFDAVRNIGYPEAQINLAHGVAYLSQVKKDRSAYNAYFAALDDVKKHGNLPIPIHLRNAPTKLMKELGYGKGYEMYPDKDKSLLPDKLKNKKYL